MTNKKSNWADKVTVIPASAVKVASATSTVDDEDDKLDIVWPLRISKRLKRDLTARAKAFGMTKQAYVRRLIMLDLKDE